MNENWAGHLKEIIVRLSKIQRWANNRLPCDYLVVDLETDGLSTTLNRPLQIGFCLVKDCALSTELWDTDFKSFILKWPKDIFDKMDPKALATHGISYERAQEEGVDPEEGVRLAFDIISFARSQGLFLAGHNLHRFDIPMLTYLFARHGFDLGVRPNELLDTGCIVKAMQLGLYPGVDDTALDFWNRVSDFRAKGVFYNLDRFCSSEFGLGSKLAFEERAHDAGVDCYLVHELITKLNELT